MAKRKLRVGMIGCGGIANAHLKGWQTRADEAEITATCDIDLKRAQDMAQRSGAKAVFTDFRKMIRNAELDAVDVCTPNRVHTPAVLAALEAGRHVICEKPLAVTTAEVLAMGRLADRRKLTLMTAQHMRFMPMSVALKAFAADGALGTPLHARVWALRRNLLPSWGMFIDRKMSGGGPCMDVGVHVLDVCMWLIDFPTPVRVTGRSRVNFAKGHAIPNAWGEWDRDRFTVEDHAVGFVHFDNGMTMELETSWLNHQEEAEVMQDTVFGSAGTLEWPSGKYSSVRNRVLYTSHIKERPGLPEPKAGELQAFLDAVVNRKPSPVPWQQTIKVIAILDGIYQSEKQKREVRIRLPRL